MSDRNHRTPPAEPDDPEPRCRAEVARIRCTRPDGHDGPHETPGGDEWADPPGEDREIDLPALREVYARQLLPEVRTGLEVVLREVLRLTREARVVAESIPGGMDRELAAVAVDLRQLERYLRVTGEAEGDVLERWESRLADVAAARARAVAGVADVLETALAAVAEEES